MLRRGRAPEGAPRGGPESARDLLARRRAARSDASAEPCTSREWAASCTLPSSRATGRNPRSRAGGRGPPKSAASTSLTRPAPASLDDALADRGRPPRHRSPPAEASVECIGIVLPVPPKRPRAPGVAAPERATRHTEVRQEPERCRRTASGRGRRCRSRACRSSRGVELSPTSGCARCRTTPSAGDLPEHSPSGLCSVDESVSRLRRCQRCRDLSFHGLCSPPRSARRRRGPGFPGDAVRWAASRRKKRRPLPVRPRADRSFRWRALRCHRCVGPLKGTSRASAFRRPPWGL